MGLGNGKWVNWLRLGTEAGCRSTYWLRNVLDSLRVCALFKFGHNVPGSFSASSSGHSLRSPVLLLIWGHPWLCTWKDTDVACLASGESRPLTVSFLLPSRSYYHLHFAENGHAKCVWTCHCFAEGPSEPPRCVWPYGKRRYLAKNISTAIEIVTNKCPHGFLGTKFYTLPPDVHVSSVWDWLHVILLGTQFWGSS
jgi:hypothetical protein